MAGLSVTRLMGDLDTPLRDARCEGERAGRQVCRKLLLRYTTECLVPGAKIEVKCPSCNTVTTIALNTNQ